MEKETMHNTEHGEKCGWCGQDRGLFSWKRIILAILLGLFIFLAGIQIGTMRSNYGQYDERPTMMQRGTMHYGNYRMNGEEGMTRTIVIPAPSLQTAPAAPATTTPAAQ